MTQPTLYLASASPRRRQLLSEAGVAFVPHVVPVDEAALTVAYQGPLERLGEHLACHKALAARHDMHAHGCDGLVLASDTTVLLDGRSLPKPVDANEAITMLRALRGREHVVATGVALAQPNGGAIRAASSHTRVRMRKYTDDELLTYVTSGDPLDKAGAYSIQHSGFRPVAGFSGCYLGVVGLPICIVAALLGHATLPPVSATESASLATTRCIWSHRCVPPYPGPSTLEASAHEQSDR